MLLKLYLSLNYNYDKKNVRVSAGSLGKKTFTQPRTIFLKLVLYNFYKKKTFRKGDVRSHVTQEI